MASHDSSDALAAELERKAWVRAAEVARARRASSTPAAAPAPAQPAPTAIAAIQRLIFEQVSGGKRNGR